MSEKNPNTNRDSNTNPASSNRPWSVNIGKLVTSTEAEREQQCRDAGMLLLCTCKVWVKPAPAGSGYDAETGVEIQNHGPEVSSYDAIVGRMTLMDKLANGVLDELSRTLPRSMALLFYEKLARRIAMSDDHISAVRTHTDDPSND